MYIGIITIGTRGDVQPYVALALGLLHKGYRVRLLAQENFKDFVEGYGVEYFPLPGNMEEQMDAPEVQAAIRAGNIISLLRTLGKGLEKLRPLLRRDILAGTEDVDAIITNMLGVPLVSAIGEKTGRPWAIVQLSSPLTPTREFPFAPMEGLNFPAYNRFSFWLLWALAWRSNRKGVNEFRQELGLPPLRQAGYDRLVQGTLNLYALSPAFLARPSDWGPNVDITGFLVLPERARQQHTVDRIPEGLESWLALGAKPIYIGFGSMPIPQPELLAIIMEEWLDQGYRIVFCQGWSARLPLKEHPNLFVLPAINHDWMLPRCRAAVIHGGIGTLAAVLRAGIPVIVVSIFGDQPWWGRYVERQGLGAFLPFRRVNVRRLTVALERALLPECQSRAAAMGERIRQEDGVGRAVERVEEYFAARRGIAVS